MSLYIEKCDQGCMIAHTFFVDKLRNIQSILSPKDGFFQLANFQWPIDTIKRIEQNKYPTEYFIKIISHLVIINDYLVNPPIISANKIHYVSLNHNNLMILDALMKQGSNPRYIHGDKYIYSEHSGVISIKNNVIESINVSANTNRIEDKDDGIFLPQHEKNIYYHEYIFHTHPNMIDYAARIKEGVLYEFPSASDIMVFMQCYNRGITQGSLVVAPEGLYVIRQIEWRDKLSCNEGVYKKIHKFILKLESEAISKYENTDASNPDFFHETIGNDFDFIRKLNEFLTVFNIFIEYYQREKKNGEWYLRSMSLMIVN